MSQMSEKEKESKSTPIFLRKEVESREDSTSAVSKNRPKLKRLREALEDPSQPTAIED